MLMGCNVHECLNYMYQRNQPWLAREEKKKKENIGSISTTLETG